MKNDPDTPHDPVATRCVVQISGFDPRGPSFYHSLFVGEAAKHSQKHGFNLEVGKRRRLGNKFHEWRAEMSHPGHAKSVSFLFLGWDDIVRMHWTKSRPSMFCKAFVTYSKYLWTGGLYRCLRLTWYPMFALLYPAIGFIALYLILMLLFGAAFAWVAATLPGLANANPIFAAGLGALTGAGTAHLISPHLQGAWLLRIYCFCRLLSDRPVPELDERLDAQAAHLLAYLEKEQPDELLVAAHSVGSIIAIPLLDRLFKSVKWQGRVSLLTMGECIPLTSFIQPEGAWFNACLKRVALHPQLDWIDFSMPSDGACFALLDPVRSTFRETISYPQPDLPKFLSPRFMEGYSKERYNELKRNRYLYHFVYLMSHDLPAAYDFPAIALGDLRLAERFRGRNNQARN